MDSSLVAVRLWNGFLAAYLALASVPLRPESAASLMAAVLAGLYAADPRIYGFLKGDFDPETPGHGLALAVVVISLWLVVLAPLVSLLKIFFLSVSPEIPTSFGGLFFSVSINTSILVGVPLLWAFAVNSERRLSESLGLSFDEPASDVVIGLAVGVLSVLLVAALGFVMVEYVGLSQGNPLAERIVDLVDLRSALVISALAAIGEETFFRGFLQTRIGLVPAAALFSIGHGSYGVATQLIGPFIFGLILGLLYERRGLLAPVAGHFAFNFSVFYAALSLGIGP